MWIRILSEYGTTCYYRNKGEGENCVILCMWQSRGRNRTLFRCVFLLRYHIQSTVVQNFCQGRGSLCYRNLSCIHASSLHVWAPPLMKFIVLQRFECGNGVELCSGVMFNFYLGLTCMLVNVQYLFVNYYVITTSLLGTGHNPSDQLDWHT